MDTTPNTTPDGIRMGDKQNPFYRYCKYPINRLSASEAVF